jgi:hypothetical protein
MRSRVWARHAAAVAWVLAACARGDPEPQSEPAPGGAEGRTPPRNCVRIDLTPLKVVRVDEPQRRLFVVTPDAGERPLAARIGDLESCFDLTDWAGRWHMSVFTDESLAGYKDQSELAAAVADGRWARAYVAEYDAATRNLARHPAGKAP